MYKLGSFGNPDPAVRKAALDHVFDSILIAGAAHSRDISLWFADGSNFPGTANIGTGVNGLSRTLRRLTTRCPRTRAAGRI